MINNLKLNFIKKYFNFINEILSTIDIKKIDNLILELIKIRIKKGRIFFIGLGGSAANASHAVNDFRKLCNINAITPLDNISELTARINDDGWKSVFVKWLMVSNLNQNDAIFFLSVGGGDKKKKVSENLIEALNYAKKKKVKVLGIVGRKKSYIYQNGDCIISVPEIEKKLVTPLTESFQSIIWHLLVSHPKLQLYKTKW